MSEGFGKGSPMASDLWLDSVAVQVSYVVDEYFNFHINCGNRLTSILRDLF